MRTLGVDADANRLADVAAHVTADPTTVPCDKASSNTFGRKINEATPLVFRVGY